jgi:hypothetical protein
VLNKQRFPGAFGPMIDFKRARAYKSVHNAKLRFSLTVKVSEALIQVRLWKCWVQIPQVGAGAKRRRVLVYIEKSEISDLGPLDSSTTRQTVTPKLSSTGFRLSLAESRSNWGSRNKSCSPLLGEPQSRLSLQELN